MSGRIYRWMIDLSERPHAAWALGLVAFCESSFFPLPPDLMLVPMSVARPNRAFFYAAVCTVASVAGGLLGYAIGAAFYKGFGERLIAFYGYGDRMAQLQDVYRHWGWAFILIKGLTPIPFKLVTILSGLMGYDLKLFVVLALITRGARFFILAGLLTHFGDAIRERLERHFAAFLAAMAAIVVAGFVIAARLM